MTRTDSCITGSPPTYSPKELLDKSTPRRKSMEPNPTRTDKGVSCNSTDNSSRDNTSSNNIGSSRDNSSRSDIGRSRTNNNSTSTNRKLLISTNSHHRYHTDSRSTVDSCSTRRS
ncbi:unnamed protein product [Closterium sp. NIES-53]